MKITIKNQELAVKHTIRTTMTWEELKGGTFKLENTADAIKYMWICTKSYNDTDITFEDFLDGITKRNLEDFLEEITNKEQPKKKSFLSRLFQRLKYLLGSR